MWINGTFGVGKTTTTRVVASLVKNAKIFDAEYVGYTLRSVLADIEPVENFQDWRPWRSLVVETARHIVDFAGGPLIIPQSVLVEQYWVELAEGFEKAGLPVSHFCLHADRDTIVKRIEGDEVEVSAKQWRLDHLDRYEAARPWLGASATTIDTTEISAVEAAETIAAQVK
ncbi:ATP-binding protein [Natronoglycomyces albus]|uniref:ATP-binding protein n=1 Tax=Natronoglycomyces albus TaxID=2811108 RepID=A0A895XTG1_9ACTN|nr:ATP-binding protein [Natronoglycomyces albus]